jgi:hypothetical protein
MIYLAKKDSIVLKGVLYMQQQKVQGSLDAALALDGALGIALGDWKSGMCLGFKGTDTPAFREGNLEMAIATTTEVIRAKMRVLEAVGVKEDIEEILIVLKTQYHLVRIVKSTSGLFFYLAMDREKGNLALARIKLDQIAGQLVL